jgi:hypothetical protein
MEDRDVGHVSLSKPGYDRSFPAGPCGSEKRRRAAAKIEQGSRRLPGRTVHGRPSLPAERAAGHVRAIIRCTRPWARAWRQVRIRRA